MRLGPALDAIIERHGYPLAVARPLAEAMVLCATLATSLKYDGIFTLQITGDGPIRLLVTDLTTDGALRGYAQFDRWNSRWRSAPATARRPTAMCRSCSATAGSPSPSTRASTPSATRAWCRSRAPTLADCAHTYFRQSEQLPTGIKIAARRDGRRTARRTGARAALMVQQMPEFDAGRIDVDREQREDDWRKAVILMASATEAEMLDPGLPGATLLYRLFHQEQPRQFERRPFVARCRCSRERIDRVLRSIKREELDDLRDSSGKVSVKCEFCSTEYAYDDSDLDRIYASAA